MRKYIAATSRMLFALATVVVLGLGAQEVFAAAEPAAVQCDCRDNEDCFNEECCGPVGGMCTISGECLCSGV